MTAKPLMPALAALALVWAAPALAGPADASCVYLAIGCGPNVPPPFAALTPTNEPDEIPPRRPHRGMAAFAAEQAARDAELR